MIVRYMITCFWDYFGDVYIDREPARTDNSVWEIGMAHIASFYGLFTLDCPFGFI
jgi:hypothetical protein